MEWNNKAPNVINAGLNIKFVLSELVNNNNTARRSSSIG